MKTKTDAAKLLLNAGWTYEEVQNVLGDRISSPPHPLRIPPIMPCVEIPLSVGIQDEIQIYKLKEQPVNVKVIPGEFNGGVEPLNSRLCS